ncbi:MAG: hypothetical protein JWN04_1444 [Myxococcaceae bacterium]|nr:hypothetical protein [Myxococcaceae bacterium]
MKRSTQGLFAALLLVPSVGLAVSTKSFVIDTSEAFEKGTLKGTAAHSSGRLTRGIDSERKPVDGVPVAYASAVGRDGAIYIATGNEGAIYRATADGVKLFADTDAALVTSLVWVENTLYAGTLPGGRVFAISSDGKTVRQHVKLAGAEHVWALAYNPKQNSLFAGTGPEGKLFAIDLQGHAQLVHDDTAEHLLCLDVDAEGRVYAGTSNGARVLRVSGKDAQVLYDFPGQEVTALDVGPSFIAVASNDFPAPPPAIGDAKDLGVAARTKRLKPGKGVLYTLGFDGRIDDLQHFDSAHISALEIDPQSGAIYAGLAQDGRIVQVSTNGEHALWADVDERQIAAIHLQSSVPHFISSDGVAVYRLRDPKAEGEWTSAVLDAKVPARFGQLTFRARGAVRISTRSGNTETPDASWSSWSNELTGAGPIKSPGARFLQLRSKLAGAAELYALEAYYLPQNLAAHVRNVRVKPPKTEDASKPRSTVLALNWDVDNPDDDKLRYRVHVRREGQTAWLPLLRDYELLEQTDYNWDTRALPDGYYRVRITVTDEATNPAPYAALSEAIGAPLLVDNHAPEVRELKFEAGKLTGRAVDALGPIAQLELAIDSGLYRPIFPVDDLLDTKEEPFRIDLPELSPGTHTLAVRATDAALNIASAAIEVSLPTR